MNVSRRLLMSVAGWLAIVAVGSTMVWTVVAHAGRDVGDTDGDPVAASSGLEPTVDSSSPAQPTGSAQPSTSPTGSTDPSPTPDETGSSDPSPTPDETGSSDPSHTPDATQDADPPASDPPPVQTHSRTWHGTAGTVIASCTGAKISGKALPNNGWRVEVDNPGPQELSVKFELTEGEDDDRIAVGSTARESSKEVEVHAHCSGGVPSFAVND